MIARQQPLRLSQRSGKIGAYRHITRHVVSLLNLWAASVQPPAQQSFLSQRPTLAQRLCQQTHRVSAGVAWLRGIHNLADGGCDVAPVVVDWCPKQDPYRQRRVRQRFASFSGDQPKPSCALQVFSAALLWIHTLQLFSPQIESWLPFLLAVIL
jgi:hypothetical protein